MDPLSLVVGAGIALTSAAPGHWRRPARSTSAATCDCAHSRSYHADDGRCHGTIQQRKRDHASITGYQRIYVRCGCQRYTGPRPVEEFLTPRFTVPTDHEEV